MANWQGLLSDPRLMDIGTGLLAQSGYSLTPVSLGQAMGGAMQFANQRDVERLKLQAAREEMEQQQQKRAAMEKLQGLLVTPMSPGPVVAPVGPAPITTAEGQAQALGLLVQIAPDAVTQGLMAQMFAKPDESRVSTDLNTFRALRPELAGTPREHDEFINFLQSKNPQAGTEMLMQQAQLAMHLENLAKVRQEREQKDETATQERQMTRRSIVTDLRTLEEMADLNQRLEGTVLQSGRPMPDLLRMGTGLAQTFQDLLGMDSSKALQLQSDFDSFKKYSTDFVVNSLDRLAGGGAITQGKFDALINANANLGASPQTNNQIIANNIEALLDGAEISGFDFDSAMVSKYRSLANKLKGSTAPPNPTLGPSASQSSSAQPSANPQGVQDLEARIQQLDALINQLGGQ
jgi:hypothetical protein